MILMDPRGGRHGSVIPTEIRSYIPAQFRVEFCHMDSGDFAWVGHGPNGRVNVGVELKHVSDILQSMSDGRLPAQLRQMRDDYDYQFLLMQDRVRADRHGYLQVWVPGEKGARRHSEPAYGKESGKGKGWWCDASIGQRQRIFYADFWKWLTSLSVCGGFRLLVAGSNQEVGRMIGGEYEWWQKAWGDHKSLKVFDESHQPALWSPSVPARVAHALVYGLGPERAMAAADHFGTVYDMVNATEAEWRAAIEEGKDHRALAKRAMRAVHMQHQARTPSGRRGDGPERRTRRNT